MRLDLATGGGTGAGGGTGWHVVVVESRCRVLFVRVIGHDRLLPVVGYGLSGEAKRTYGADRYPSVKVPVMVTYSDPRADADAAREALRGLAHATRTIGEPGDTYAVLGSLSAGLASLGQSLDQLAEWHHRPDELDAFDTTVRMVTPSSAAGSDPNRPTATPGPRWSRGCSPRSRSARTAPTR